MLIRKQGGDLGVLRTFWGFFVMQETRVKGKNVKETATSLFHRPPFCAVCDVIAGGVSQCMLGNSQVICILGSLGAKEKGLWGKGEVFL